MTSPERIHGWQLTQLSTARHFGGCHYLGARYYIDDAAEGWPLVRARADAARLAQGGLF